MKTFIVLFLCVFIFHFTLNAQVIKTFGPKISFTNSSLETDFFPESFSSRSAFNFGFSTEFFPTDYFSINVAINYVQKGFIEKSIETNDVGKKIKDVNAENKLFYISVPLLAKFMYKNNISPFISLGPRFDYLVSKENGVFNYTNVSIKSEMLDFYDNFTYGASGSIGIEIPDLIPTVITLEISYNLDFKDSSNNTNIELKNRSFDIWIGFMF
jgi:hypothetical protein